MVRLILNLLAAEDNWSPAFHDNTLLDWIITFGYFAAAGLCFYSWKCEFASANRTFHPRFWLVMAILTTLLGINKQLNLQTFLGDLGRDAAEDEGWYQHRRTIQKLFVIAFGLAGLGVLGAMGWWIRRQWKRYGLALAGLLLAGLYAALRAATFHHVLHDTTGPRHHPYSQEVLEVAAVILVGLGAWWAVQSNRRPKLQSFERVVKIR